jgi:tetratricopeptide (TPR) repeat protein
MIDRVAACLRYAAGLWAIRRARFLDAAQHFEAVTRARPNQARAMYYRAWALWQADQLRPALAAYRELIHLTPDVGRAHFEMGIVLQELQLHREAIESFQRASQCGVVDALLRFNWGVSAAALGQYGDAIEQYRRALDLSPSLCQAQGNLGSILIETGQVDEAIPWLQRAAEGQPSAIHLYNLADALFEVGRLAEAERVLRDGLAKAADSVRLRTLLAAVLGDQNRSEEALELLDGTLQRDPAQPEPLMARTAIYVQAGRHQDALRDAARVLELAPNDSRAEANAGMAFLAAGEAVAALGHFRQATALDPDVPEYLSGTGAALMALGRIEDAATQFERVLSMNPTYVEKDESWRAQWAAAGVPPRQLATGEFITLRRRADETKTS